MGLLPERRSKDDGPPPLVAYWRDVIRTSRAGRFIARHKNASAAIAALYAVSKAWKWFVIDLIRWGTHPGATLHWATHHSLLAVGLSAAVFAVAFVVSRLGIDWVSRDHQPQRERPHNRHVSTHVPGR